MHQLYHKIFDNSHQIICLFRKESIFGMDINQIEEEFLRVVVRCRPQIHREKNLKDPIIVNIEQDKNIICVKSTSNLSNETKIYSFNFDTIFDENSTQKQIYSNVATPIIESLLQGINGTILAYGQTGSGKSNTIFGHRLYGEEGLGITIRAVREVFDRIKVINKQCEESKENVDQFQIYGSFYSLYNEKIRDLLGDQKKIEDLRIRQNIQNNFYIEGLTKKRVENEQQLLELIEIGQRNQIILTAHMGECSSRNFNFLELFIVRENTVKGIKYESSLKIVDFCGSERIINGMQFSEPKLLFSSLRYFENVISALTNNQAVIPYRESKVTKLLSQSLGGNSRATIIYNIISYLIQIKLPSPSQISQDETISTLNLATKSQNIRNKIKINQSSI